MHKFIPWAIGAGLLTVALGATQGKYFSRSALLLQQQFQPQPITQAPAGQLAQEQPNDDELSRPNGGMTLDRLKAILESETENVQEQQGQFEFVYKGRTMVILTHTPLNRMRIVTPVVSEADLTEEQRQQLLVANFHTALDGRYALSNGTVFAVFLHPLSTLDDDDFRSALSQVHSLAQTFGSSYSSGVLQFGGQRQQPQGPLEGLPGT